MIEHVWEQVNNVHGDIELSHGYAFEGHEGLRISKRGFKLQSYYNIAERFLRETPKWGLDPLNTQRGNNWVQMHQHPKTSAQLDWFLTWRALYLKLQKVDNRPYVVP